MEKENRIFTLRMGLLIPVTILYCIAAAEAIVGLLSFDIDAYWEMLVQMEIWDPRVITGSSILFALIGLLMVFWPGLLGICLILSLANRPGFSVLSTVADIFSKMIRYVRYVLIGLFVIFVVRYVILCLPQDMIVYLLVAMFLFEGLFGVGLYFFLQLLIRFFSAAADTLASVQYIRYSGKPEYCSSYITVHWVLILLGILGIGIGVYLSLFPFTGLQCVDSLWLTSIANISLSILLKVCQTRISHAAYRLEKETKKLGST